MNNIKTVDQLNSQFIEAFNFIIQENVKYLLKPEYVENVYDEIYGNWPTEIHNRTQALVYSFFLTMHYLKKHFSKSFDIFNNQIVSKFLEQLKDQIILCLEYPDNTGIERYLKFLKERLQLYKADHKEYLNDKNYLRPLTIHSLYIEPRNGQITLDSCFLNNKRFKNLDYFSRMMSFNIVLKNFENALDKSIREMADTYQKEIVRLNYQ